jgi:aldehyde dehydrogenase (NAD+)
VVDQSQLDQDLGYVKIAQDEGGKLVAGGERLKRDTEGFYMSPGAHHRDHAFDAHQSRGSVRPGGKRDPRQGLRRGARGRQRHAVRPHRRHRHAVAEARHALQAQRRGRHGDGQPAHGGVDYHVPFGGRKGSSYGPREQGAYAKEFYTVVKTAYIQA